jgi:hypothetical protein
VHVEGPEHLVLPPLRKVGIFGHLAACERGQEAVGVECSDAEAQLVLRRRPQKVSDEEYLAELGEVK